MGEIKWYKLKESMRINLYVAITDINVKQRIVFLRNLRLFGKESVSYPLLHINTNH